ncbi:hypothetical protein GCM10008066_24260 [Oxalicibacterium faecigallinarum]|uniref:Uncharacterized protein n=1 Tax=Oxalicibacterium faecigallinarum TaxID=573741 RepID=A0A8J3AZE9_9BURK|nr:hypothetical protein GCM10008066_24260 [Oxalicibacterium faecigallinarum]
MKHKEKFSQTHTLKAHRSEKTDLSLQQSNTYTTNSIEELIDAANEICVAVEIFMINRPQPEKDYVVRILQQRKITLLDTLTTFRAQS